MKANKKEEAHSKERKGTKRIMAKFDWQKYAICYTNITQNLNSLYNSINGLTLKNLIFIL